MEITTGIRQLFTNLCHSNVWSYAILWKLQKTTQMLLACDDAYVSATESHVSMEYAPWTSFQGIDPVVTTFGCENIALTGDVPGCSIEAVISNISRHSYFLGAGIVGITASSEKHQWISLCDSNSRLLLEYPEELQLQAAAGIKTVLLVPLLPLGVVQLGSFYKLSEDLNMVAQIKDLFLTFQYTLELQPTFDLETNNGTAICSSKIKEHSASLDAGAELNDSSNFQQVSMQDWTNLNYDEVIVDEFLPELVVQPYDSLPQDGVATVSSEDFFWDAMCNELLTDCSMEQALINSSTNTISKLIGDQSILLSYRDEEIDRIPCLAPEDPIMSDNEFSYDPHRLDEAYLGFVEEFDLVMDSITDGLFLNHPGESASLFQFHETAWVATNPSDANEPSNSTSIFQAQVPKPVEEPAAIMKDSRADLESSGCQNSSITQWKDGDFMPPLIFNTQGFTIQPMTVQSNSIDNMPPSNEDQQDVDREPHKGSSGKQGKKRGSRGPKPRDRQLIQQRITELRKLIPNGSKCSIDELLERAVKHMVFLESVPAHAEKLDKSNRTKVGESSKSHGKALLPQNESSFTCELERKGKNLPLIIENLEQADQMLIEIQCRDYGLFLDTAQAFKKLNVTILEGTLQSRPWREEHQQWAHFILQVPEGFNRMDILWPLMRLLQFQF